MKINNIFFILTIFLISCDKDYHTDLLKNVIGIDNVNYKLLCFHEDLSFQGEGFSIFVYSLEISNIKEFLAKDISKYPKKTQYRENWFVLEWRKGPLVDLDKGLYNQLISYYNFDKNNCLNKNDLESLITDSNNYYSAYYYDDDRKEPLSVEIFILDIKENKLYFISNKT